MSGAKFTAGQRVTVAGCGAKYWTVDGVFVWDTGVTYRLRGSNCLMHNIPECDLGIWSHGPATCGPSNVDANGAPV
jgi:hypothetical protein